MTINVLEVSRPPQMSNTTYEVLSLNATAGYTFSPPLSAVNRNGNPVTYAVGPGFEDQFSVTNTTGVLSIIGANLNARYGMVRGGHAPPPPSLFPARSLCCPLCNVLQAHLS